MSRNVILINTEVQISDLADSINLRSTGGHWGDQIRSKTLIAPQALYVQLPKTHAVSEKGCPRRYVRYAVLSSGRGMCQQIRHHRKFLGGGCTLKGIQKKFYERLGTGGGSTRSISVATNSKMDDFATIWKSLIRPLYSPEIVQGCAMRVCWLVSVIWSVVG